MANIIALILLCFLTLPAVVLTHHRLNAWPSGTRWVTRGIVTAVGLGFAIVMAFVYAPAQQVQSASQLLIFISAFGIAHIPPAAVLQLKHWRGRDEVADKRSKDMNHE